MSTLEIRLQDQTYKNWVKTGLCLALLKEGLEEYAEIKSKEFHDAVLASVAKIQTYQTAICDNERITFDNNNNGKIACNHAFCQGFLNEVVNLGIDPTQKFKIRKANIENCDVKLWPTNHWELAKLFMNQGQKPCHTNPSQTDLSGILNFLEHCQVPRNGIQNAQHIDEARHTRNSVMHTSDMKVSPSMFQTYTQTMLDLLRDSNLAKLSSVKHAESEIQKVIQADFQILLEDEITVLKNWMTALEKATNDAKTEIRELIKISTSMQQKCDEEKKTLQTQIQQMEEETNKIADSLAALTKQVSDDKTLQEKIGLEVENLHGSLEQATKDLWDAHNELKRRVNETEHKIMVAAQERKVLYDRHAKLKLKTSASISDLSIRQANTESGACEIKRRQEDIEQKVIFAAQERMALYDRQTKMESRVKEIKSAAMGDEDCRKLRESLVKEYSRLYKDIYLSHFVEELNNDALRVPIDKNYCDLDIVKIQGNRQYKLETESDSDTVSFSKNDYDDKFFNSPTANTHGLKSYSEMFSDTEIKNIVIKGEGGTGKSTWCKRLLHAWCQVQRRELGMEGASDEANSDMEESLKRFDYLFYVTLRHVKHQSPLKDMLLFTGLDRLSVKRKVCELILANNSENVLILSDGFDEYPFTLDCQGLGHSTIVMTTRPWKYDVLRSRDNNFKVDAVSEIRGLTHRGVLELSKKVIASYSKQYLDIVLESSDAKEQADVFVRDSRSAGLSDSIRIPLILIITVLTWLENKKSLSTSLICNILGLLGVIFQRGETKLSLTDKQVLTRVEQEKKEPSAFHEGLTAKYKFMCDNQLLLQHLGRLAYKGLTDQKKGLSLVFTGNELHEFLESEELEICYKLGLLTRSAVTTSLLGPPQVSISFYHKLIQEFFAAIGIISSSDNFSEFTKILTSHTAITEMNNVIHFITALNPCTASDLSKYISDLAETDHWLCLDRKDVGEVYTPFIVHDYSNLLFDWMSEWDSVHDDRKKQKQLYLTYLIIESDFERKLRLCTSHSMEHLKLLKVSRQSDLDPDDIKQMLSQLTTLISKAASLKFLTIRTYQVSHGGIEPADFDLTKNEHLEHVIIKEPFSDFFCLTFSKTVQLRTLKIQNAIINMLDLQKINSLELKYVKIKEIRLPTRLEELQYVSLESVTMPASSSWNTFFQILLSASLTQLILTNFDINDSTINLEKSFGLKQLVLKDVKIKEIRLPTRQEELKYVILESVTMPGSSWNTFFQILQSPSLTQLKLKNFDMDDITINLENSSDLQCLTLEDVKMKEIRLQTRLEELNFVTFESVTIPGSLSSNTLFQLLQSPTLTRLILKNLNIDKIKIPNCETLRRLEISNLKLAEIDISSTERLEIITAEEVALPESQASSFFNQVLLSLYLRHLTMKDISLGRETVWFDRWPYLLSLRLYSMVIIKIQLENVIMSEESYECLCKLQKAVKFNENQLTKHSIDRGLFIVSFFGEKKIRRGGKFYKELLPYNF